MDDERRRRAAAHLLGLQLALFIGLGLPEGALGVAWPSMRATFHRGRADLGFVLAAGTLGYLVGSGATGWLLGRAGTGRLAAGAATVAAVTLAVEAGAPVWAVLLAAAAVLGVARGATDASLNAVVAEHGGVRQLGLLHAGFGVGTTLAPLAVIALLPHGWRPAWAALAVVTAGLALWAWPARRRWPPVGTAAMAVPATAGDGVAPGRSRRAVLPLTLVTFAFYVGAEFGTASWAYTLLVQQRGADRTAAGLAVASFWGALTGGRFVLWFLGERVERTTLLWVGSFAAAAGLGWLAADPGGAGWVGLPVAGLAMAPIFPTLIALMPDRLGADRSARAIGFSVAAASLGGTALSAAAGVLPLAPTLAAYGLALVVAQAALSAAAQPLNGLRPR